MILFLDDVCSNDDLLNVLSLVRLAIRIIQIAVPIALILLGTIDMGKAVIAGDEKKMKEAQKPFIKRIISAVIVFIIPFIVNLVMNFVTTNNDDWKNCWKNAGEHDFTKFDPDSELR